jgi:hypothetical protein
VAVKTVGTLQQQAMAFQGPSCHPELQFIAKAATATSSAEFNALQMEKWSDVWWIQKRKKDV